MSEHDYLEDGIEGLALACFREAPASHHPLRWSSSRVYLNSEIAQTVAGLAGATRQAVPLRARPSRDNVVYTTRPKRWVVC